MTIIEKRVAEIMVARCGTEQARAVVEEMARLGMTDQKRCRAAVARECVRRLTSEGVSKVQAMYMAAEECCCSYECVRNYVYDRSIDI